MCTSIVTNFKTPIIGFNLDFMAANIKVDSSDVGVYIEINDPMEGWMPLFGANNKGTFVAMPTCWPFDERSNQKAHDDVNIINLDIDLLLDKISFLETYQICKEKNICSIDYLTFMGHHSNIDGDILQIIPGQGIEYIKAPKYDVMTNFSKYKMNSETHPYMGWDRYTKANELLEKCNDDFNYKDMMNILKEVSQEVCPTRVSMVFDVKDMMVYWCIERNFDKIESKKLIK